MPYTVADAERRQREHPPEHDEPPIRRQIAAPGTGQRATLEILHTATAAVIQQAFTVARAASTPAMRRFAEAYGAELKRLQADAGDDAETARVLLTWLYQSGQLAHLRGPVLRALVSASHQSLSATLLGQQTAFAAARAVGLASMRALAVAQTLPDDTGDVSLDDYTDDENDAVDNGDDLEVDAPPIPGSWYGQSSYDPNAGDENADESREENAPIAGYFDKVADKGWATLTTVIFAALASGMDPAQMLANMLGGWQGAAAYALLVAESELTGAFRNALSLLFNANPNYVAGWIWQAMADACPFCSDMDQTFHDPDEDMISHPRCRCEQLPVDNNGNIIGGGDAADIGTLAAPTGAGAAAAAEEEAAAAEEEAAAQAQAITGQLEQTVTREAEARAETEAAAAPERFEQARSLDQLREWYDAAGGTREDAEDAIRMQLAMDLATIAPLSNMGGLADTLDRVAGERADALADILDRAASLTPDDLAALDTAGEQGADAFRAELEQLTGAEFPRAALTVEETSTLLHEAVTVAEHRIASAEQTMVQLEARYERAMETGAARDAIMARDYHAAHVGLITAHNDLELAQDALRGLAQEEGFALREPVAAAAAKATSYTTADLAGKTMPELRQIARDAGVAPARSKADTIQRILDKQQAAALSPSDRVALLRSQVDERMAEREMLYKQQSDLNFKREQQENIRTNTPWRTMAARNEARQALYRDTLDKTDPDVKRYFKDRAAHDKAGADAVTAEREAKRLEEAMDRIAIQGQEKSEAYRQAKADYDAAIAAAKKGRAAEQRAWQNLWTKSPSVYKPELDSVAGFDYRMQQQGITFSPEQVANHPAMLAEQRATASIDGKIADIERQLRTLDKPIKDINKAIDKQLAELRDLNAPLRSGADALDTLRPFNDVIALPEGHQPPNALMNKLDYRMHEPRAVTKSRIIDDITARLKDNPAWEDYVSRTPTPDNLGAYHQYVHVQANARDTKSAKLVADLVRKWGIGYRPGTPMWVALQLSAKAEFGLDASIHLATIEQIRAGAQLYARDGDAIRSFLRAMYDNTQAWFADNGITEIEVYRGFGWAEGQEMHLPTGIDWGPMDKQRYGTTDMELNPFQSFSADINISQGSGSPLGIGAHGFAGAGGFGVGGSDYSLLVGARIPVDRVLGTAQTGFGAKLESEIVVMGRATDTVAYRAGTRVEAALLRYADEQAMGEREMLYTLADKTTVSVVANADGTFTLAYLDGPEGKLGSFKLGGSKTYKTEKGINNALKAVRLGNTYAAPELAVREGEGAAGAGEGAAVDGLHAQIERVPADLIVADIEDWLKQEVPSLARVDLMSLSPAAARLVANATANLVQALPEVAGNIWQIAAQTTITNPVAYVTQDGLSLILDVNKWADLQALADSALLHWGTGWWVDQTPEVLLGHEIGHALQVNYHIDNALWQAAMDRVAAAGGEPLVSTYAGDAIEESFAETFALLVYGTPTDAQSPIVQEMARLLGDNGLDYHTLRSAVGSPPLELGS